MFKAASCFPVILPVIIQNIGKFPTVSSAINVTRRHRTQFDVLLYSYASESVFDLPPALYCQIAQRLIFIFYFEKKLIRTESGEQNFNTY